MANGSAAPSTASIPTSSSSSPFIDRVSRWASDNKTVVYTIAGVAVVLTGAGVYYYSNNSKYASVESLGDQEKRASKKERRKAKKEKERAEAKAAPREVSSEPSKTRKTPTVESDPSEDLPTINEETVDTFSQEV